MHKSTGSLSTFPQIQNAYSNPPPATSLANNDRAQQQQQQNTQTHTRSRSNSITSRFLRPTTSSGDQQQQQQQQQQQPKVTLYPSPPPETPRLGGVLAKERRPSFGRKSSFSRLRRSSSASNVAAAAAKEPPGRQGKLRVTTDHSAPPLPDINTSRYSRLDSSQESYFYLQSPPLSADSFSKMLSRTTTNNGGQMAPPPGPTSGQTDSYSMVYQHIQETANKRISTLDYLRKAHEGRVYWFNTLLFDKPDLARMPYFDSRKLARRATNYLLLGLSLPAVVDLNSSTPLEFLRSLNILLGEFETFQTLHSESGTAASSLSRARIPNMFRRGAQSSKTRRTSGANDLGIAGLDQSESNGGPLTGNPLDGGSSAGGDTPALSFAASDTDLLPGEEYTHLLTPSLPFDPDFFETFATLCDVLIDCYRRLLTLLSSPRDCNAQIAELFTKADARVRKIIIQGAVKEFEDTSRAGVKNEVANVGKVVLGSLM